VQHIGRAGCVEIIGEGESVERTGQIEDAHMLEGHEDDMALHRRRRETNRITRRTGVHAATPASRECASSAAPSQARSCIGASL
jgi:hypothetical protein